MPTRYPIADLTKTTPSTIAGRPSKVRTEDFASPATPDASFRTFLDSLPNILAGADLRAVVEAIVAAKRAGKPVLVSMGAHVIKCGLSPVLIDLMERGVIDALALNGAGSVHDVEIALFGITSEDVNEALQSGDFGMAKEPCDFLNESAAGAAEQGKGLGEALGERLLESTGPNLHLSVLAAGARLGIPVTVHVAVGTDINHMHPSASGAAIGEATFTDFRVFAAAVSRVGDGGVILNLGSAVVLPMIIEKALAVARNLGHPVERFTGVNFDFIRHYRSTLNPVVRSKVLGGDGYQLMGHHEILIPLLAHAVVARLGARES